MSKQIKTIFHCVLLIMMITGVGCSSNSTDIEDSLTSSINQIDIAILRGDRKIVIIPGEGCGGCISNATSHIINNIDNLQVNVIFTGVGDLKLLRLELGSKFLERSDVYLDSNNLLMNPLIASIYPRILTLTRNQVRSIENFNP